MWKVGLVGTGFWSEKHLKAWSRIPGVEIKALCNRSPAKLLAKATEYRVPESELYSSIDEMLASADIHVVDIVTGPETHLDMVRKAAAAGKHIMCQKPFAPSLEEAEEIVRRAEEAGVRLMVTENWRWLQPFQTIKSVLDSGVLGKLQVARYYHSDYYSPRFAPENEIPQPFFREMPKLLFYEMGVHWFDTWRYLFGMPKRLYAELAQGSPYIIGDDTGTVTLGYDDFYGVMDASWATRREHNSPVGSKVSIDHKESLVIDGTSGSLKLYINGDITIIDHNGERFVAEKTSLDHEESHFRLQSHFIGCLNSGEAFQTSGADNLDTLRLAFGVYQSANKHEVIKF